MGEGEIMKTRKITGGGGIQLHVMEAGDPKGKPILFIHGFSMCGLCWKNQMNSPLLNEFRLIFLDCRGHGLSDKPKDAYGDTNLWADDIRSVIATLQLKRLVLIGWSYGGEIICDYLRHYGEEDIAGVNFVGALSKVGPSSWPFIGKDFMALSSGFVSNNTEETVSACQKFSRFLMFREPDPEEICLFLGCALMVPPYVRAGLMSRSVENDDVLSRIKKPVLITHGDKDQIILIEMAKYNASKIPHSQISLHAEVGRSPFWEDPERFNSEVYGFVSSLG